MSVRFKIPLSQLSIISLFLNCLCCVSIMSSVFTKNLEVIFGRLLMYKLKKIGMSIKP